MERYDEIKAIVFDILSGRERVNYEPSQENSLEVGVAEVLSRRGTPSRKTPSFLSPQDGLSSEDSTVFREVFNDLLREGILNPGLDNANRKLPFFSVSTRGRKLMGGQPAAFYDEPTYTKLIHEQIPAIDPTTLMYLQEAMRAYKADCILSSTVMLGVATEDVFLTLLETIDANPKHQATYAIAQKDWSILKRFNKFRLILENNKASLPNDLREDLDTQFAGIQSIIRTFRNDAGHPTGTVVSKEQCYVLLNLFIPYAKKMYQLIEHFAQP